MISPQKAGPLAGLTVLEVAGGVAGPLAGLHCELLGATVIKTEVTGPDPARRWGTGAVFRLFNSGKQMVEADLDELGTIASSADAVIADRHPDVERVLRDLSQCQQLCSIVLIDHAAVPGGWRSSETTVQAAAAYPNYLGSPARRPFRLGADIAWSTAAVQAVQATLAHVLSPGGSKIAIVSPMRAALTDKTIQLASRSDPGAWSGYHVLGGTRPPDRGYRARDGRLSFEFPPERHEGWQLFCRALGLDEIVDEPDWYETTGLGSLADEFRAHFEDRLVDFDRAQVIDLARANGGWAVPFLSGLETRRATQSTLYAAVSETPGGDVVLRSPWRLNGKPVAERSIGSAFEPTDAPDLGRDDDVGGRGRETSEHGLPLAGVRVVDLGIGGVGPWASDQLAQLGATVVKIEAPNEFILDVMPPWKWATTSYAALNLGKASIRLDLKSDEDRSIAWELIEAADVVVENFRAGAMDRLGFGFDAVAQRNPAVVYCTSNGFGSSGPMAGLPCTDPHMQAFGGVNGLNGDGDGGERLRYYAAVDLFTSCVVTEGVLAALVQQRRSGVPQQVEVTMLAAATTMCLSQWAEDLESGSDSGAVGSRGRHVHPDGLYRTADRAIALTAGTDAEFARLCAVIERPELVDDPRFADASHRLMHPDELDAEIEAVLAAWPADWWLTQLRRADLACSSVNTERALLDHRESWTHRHLRIVADDDAANGDRLVVAGPPWDFEGVSPAPAWAPMPGEHTDAVRATADRWAAIAAIIDSRSAESVFRQHDETSCQL
jgi:crotonobetainyl-CoA:carnitine CoA-transferase CaiB-like acyl-CoA transferase